MNIKNIKHFSKTANFYASDYQGWVYFGREDIHKYVYKSFVFVNKHNKIGEGIEINFISKSINELSII